MKALRDVKRRVRRAKKNKPVKTPFPEFEAGFLCTKHGVVRRHTACDGSPSSFLIAACTHQCERTNDQGIELSECLIAAAEGQEEALRTLIKFTARRGGLTLAFQYVLRKLGADAAEKFLRLLSPHRAEVVTKIKTFEAERLDVYRRRRTFRRQHRRRGTAARRKQREEEAAKAKRLEHVNAKPPRLVALPGGRQRSRIRSELRHNRATDILEGTDRETSRALEYPDPSTLRHH